jgi:diaminopimelate epimerase
MSDGPSHGMEKRLSFVKMSGGGNDFIIVDDRTSHWAGRESWLARTLCPRGTAVGADGLILVRRSEKADARMAYVNSGGDTAALCGNGGRCLASYLHRMGLAGSSSTIETGEGTILSAEVADSQVKLEMAPISWPPQSIKAETAAGDGSHKVFPGEFLTVGVPHFVHHLPSKEFTTIEVNRWGAALRGLGIFGAAGSNVNFYSVVDKGTRTLAVRTYERGVEAETLACGTGCTATALVAAEQFGFPSPVRCLTRGGSLLTVGFGAPGDPSGDAAAARWGKVMLQGEARRIFDGIADLQSV